MRLLVDFVDPDGSLCAAAQLAAVDLDPAVTAAVRVVQGGVMLGQPQKWLEKIGSKHHIPRPRKTNILNPTSLKVFFSDESPFHFGGEHLRVVGFSRLDLQGGFVADFSRIPLVDGLTLTKVISLQWP